MARGVGARRAALRALRREGRGGSRARSVLLTPLPHGGPPADVVFHTLRDFGGPLHRPPFDAWPPFGKVRREGSATARAKAPRPRSASPRCGGSTRPRRCAPPEVGHCPPGRRRDVVLSANPFVRACRPARFRRRARACFETALSTTPEHVLCEVAAGSKAQQLTAHLRADYDA